MPGMFGNGTEVTFRSLEVVDLAPDDSGSVTCLASFFFLGFFAFLPSSGASEALTALGPPSGGSGIGVSFRSVEAV